MSEEDSLAAEPFFPNGVDEYGEPIDSESLPKPPSELAALLEAIGDLESLSDQELDDLLDHFRTWGRAGTGQAIRYALDGLEGESLDT